MTRDSEEMIEMIDHTLAAPWVPNTPPATPTTPAPKSPGFAPNTPQPVPPLNPGDGWRIDPRPNPVPVPIDPIG